MSMLDELMQYFKDAAPGGSLNPELTPSGVRDAAALATSPIPIAGDVVGLLADAHMYATEPEERTIANGILSALGVALPFVGGAATIKAAQDFPLEDAMDADFFDDLADFLFSQSSAAAKGAHEIRGGQHFHHPEFEYNWMSPEEAEIDLGRIGRQENVAGNISEYSRRKHIRESLPTKRWEELLEEGRMRPQTQKPIYVSRAEGAYSDHHVHPSYNERPDKANNIVSTELIDMSMVDPKQAPSWADPYFKQDNLVSNYGHTGPEPYIYRLDADADPISTLGLADRNEILVRRGDLGKARQKGLSMSLSDYFDLLNEGAAPFAVGGIGAAILLNMLDQESEDAFQ